MKKTYRLAGWYVIDRWSLWEENERFSRIREVACGSREAMEAAKRLLES